MQKFLIIAVGAAVIFGARKAVLNIAEDMPGLFRKKGSGKTSKYASIDTNLPSDTE